jgi:hypothetical protein
MLNKLQDYVFDVLCEERTIESFLLCMFLPLLGLIVIIYHIFGYFRNRGFNK